jgi:hypothetical protein
MPQHPDRRIADGEILPDPEDGDRTRPARNRLDLPRSGELRLGGGQAVVAFAETGQVGGGEALSRGETCGLLPCRELCMSFYLVQSQGPV